MTRVHLTTVPASSSLTAAQNNSEGQNNRDAQHRAPDRSNDGCFVWKDAMIPYQFPRTQPTLPQIDPRMALNAPSLLVPLLN
ncbi:hypothetical protein K491DRAFT_350656 [Lophiostoma macrostomum CBS 122681]|uniref:Uncharacterized protein n=1 Tax=Lophiostoma macrostomum CBS 122681 TaxID=1314788 RepID=A0A6A6TCB9_9PLEO|nr:hypothetical protein K491DRAFT_350656 [Lophiostoma macrostomum CBS 122681]